MTDDDRVPPWWDRSVHVLHQPSMQPWPFRVWCGEHLTMISSYETADEAAVASHRHLDHGGHRTMPTQQIQPDAVTEALVEFIAEQTGQTDAFDVRLTAAGDDLVVTYKVPDDTELVFGYRYAALTVDPATRALIEEATA